MITWSSHSTELGRETRQRFLVIKPSRINGVGVFSTCCYPRKRVIYAPEVLRVFSTAARGTIQRGRSDHVDDPYILRWLNHSCRPNAEINFKDGKLLLVSIADISRGDELTCDYRRTEDEIPVPFFCTCGLCVNQRIAGRMR